MATSVLLLLSGAMLQAVGEVDVLGSYNSTLGTSYVLEVPDSCGNLTLVNHGILDNQTESKDVRLFLLRDRPELESHPGVNFTTSYILSTSPESCALGSAFRLYPGTTVSVSGCYSATGDDETDTEFYIIKDLQNFTDSYCNWDSHSLQAYPLSACGEESGSVQMESSTTLGEEADYYFALHNSGGSSRNAFTRTQIELALNITGYTVSESEVLGSCDAYSSQSCSIMIDVHQSYFALVMIDPPEDGMDQWQQYVETEILCTSNNSNQSGGHAHTLQPWVYGVAGGGVAVCVVLTSIPVAIVARRKCKSKRKRRETLEHREFVTTTPLLHSLPPPSYNEIFSYKTGGPRGESDASQRNLEQFATDQPDKCYQTSSEETPGPAPESSNHGDGLLVGSPCDFAAAIL